MKTALTAADILPEADYARIRNAKKRELIELKKRRRLAVGPYAMFYFENFQTMWHQVQEMLYIEKGGAEQLIDELRAYNPLIPKGDELVATVMFEIPDAGQRQKILATLGGVEKTFEIRLDNEAVPGLPETDLDYSTAEGKASSVQFVHFRFTKPQIEKFRAPGVVATLAITHPHYGHMATIPTAIREELAKDFA